MHVIGMLMLHALSFKTKRKSLKLRLKQEKLNRKTNIIACDKFLPTHYTLIIT